MTLSVLFFLWTVHGGLAARMGVGGMDVNVAKVLSLLQSRGDSDTHADILSQLAITPGLDMKNVIEQMADNVKAKVKAGQAATQVAINKAIDDLDGTTRKTLGLKAEADTKDGSWFACVEQEKEKKAHLEDAQKAWMEATNTRTRLCKIQEDKKAFRWLPKLVNGFTCDFSEASCSEQVEKYSSKLNDLLSAVRSSESTASDEYNQAKQACDQAKEDEEQKNSAFNNASHAFQDQQKDCLQKSDVRRASMCSFGEELQVKCRQVSEFEAFVEEVNAVKGSEHSHPDRIQEWTTADLIRCMLSEGGSDIDANLLKTCEAKVNYNRDIGEFLKRTDELARLTSPDNFTCSESSITFHGKTWEIPPDAESSDYTVKDYHPKINFEDESVPFGLCADPVTTCGGNGKGGECHFPFTFKGKTYHNCTEVDHNQPWCSMHSEYNGKWGNCECK